jgi:hypothetical protein
MFQARVLAIFTLVLAAAATRILPHPPNCTAVGALALFGGAYFSRRWLAIAAPLAAMLIGDAVLSVVLFGGSFTWAGPTSYVCFAMTALLGMLLRERAGIGRVATAAVAASVLFFLISNFSVWLGSRMYSQTPAGLMACYIAAIPFAQSMLLGNLFYTGVLFGGMHAIERFWPALREREQGATVPVTVQ